MKRIFIFRIPILGLAVLFLTGLFMTACQFDGKENLPVNQINTGSENDTDPIDEPPAVEYPGEEYDDSLITNIENGYTVIRLHDEYGFEEKYGYFSAYFTEYHRGWVYFIGPDEHDRSVTYRMRPDGTEKQKVIDDPGFSSGVYHDGWYYYADQWVTIGWGVPPPSQLHRMRLDGSEKMTYSNTGSVDRFVLDGEWIYYISNNDLYRINVDETGKEKITDGCSGFIVSAGYIFVTLGGYTGGPAQYDTKLARFNLDGTGKILLIENERIVFSPVFTDNDYLYYQLYYGGAYFGYGESMKGGQLHRMKFDGTDIQTIIEHPSKPGADYYTLNNIIQRDGFIYYNFYQIDRSMGGTYSDWNFISEIYKIRTDGTDHVKLYNKGTQYFDIFGDSIFFTTVEGASIGDRYNTINLNRLSINGSSHEIVYSNRGSERFSGYFVHNNKLYVVVTER